MTIARRKQICLQLTPYYHCTTRCVRRAYLCGYDKLTKRNFDHRRGWIEERLIFLSEVFCIDVAGFAVLSNHYHAILRVDQDKAQTLTDEQVIDRWSQLYKTGDLIQSFRNGIVPSTSALKTIQSTLAHWRDQLSNLSRFMGNLNQTIARRANAEDKCKGRFWERRFHSQAILDEEALLKTLCYVDLNPMRAKMAKTPEQSEYTSIKRRLRKKTDGLVPFSDSSTEGVSLYDKTLPISFGDYLTMLDWSGRQLHKGKRGAIANHAPPIFERLGYSSTQWMKSMRPRVPWAQRAVGSVERVKAYCEAIGQRWVWRLG